LLFFVYGFLPKNQKGRNSVSSFFKRKTNKWIVFQAEHRDYVLKKLGEWLGGYGKLKTNKRVRDGF